MTADDILSSEEFNRCVYFHGHICPGIAIGYRASLVALDWLKEKLSVKDEIVTISESDSCAIDAVQVLTGCTIGKGNLLFKDNGKIVFTFIDRNLKKGVRVALKSTAIDIPERHKELIGKILNNCATEEEQEEFRQVHHQRFKDILEKPWVDLFAIREVEISFQLPPSTKNEPSDICYQCGEPTITSKLNKVEGGNVCNDCKK